MCVCCLIAGVHTEYPPYKVSQEFSRLFHISHNPFVHTQPPLSSPTSTPPLFTPSHSPHTLPSPRSFLLRLIDTMTALGRPVYVASFGLKEWVLPVVDLVLGDRVPVANIFALDGHPPRFPVVLNKNLWLADVMERHGALCFLLFLLLLCVCVCASLYMLFPV